MKKRSLSALVTVAALAAVGFTPSVAAADPAAAPRVSTYGCDPGLPKANGYYWSIVPRSRHIGDKSTRVWGQSGGTISVSRSKSVTTSGSITGTVSADAGVVFAQVSTSVGVTVGASRTTTRATGYSWKVPKSQKRGWVEEGHNGYSIQWEKGTVDHKCRWTRHGRGYVLGNTNQPSHAHS